MVIFLTNLSTFLSQSIYSETYVTATVSDYNESSLFTEIGTIGTYKCSPKKPE